MQQISIVNGRFDFGRECIRVLIYPVADADSATVPTQPKRQEGREKIEEGRGKMDREKGRGKREASREKREEGRASSESSDRVDEWLLGRVVVVMLLRVVE